MERTKEYKAILKTCKVRLGKDGGVPKKVKKNHSKSEQSGGRPLTRAIEVRQSISELKSYIGMRYTVPYMCHTHCNILKYSLTCALVSGIRSAQCCRVRWHRGFFETK